MSLYSYAEFNVRCCRIKYVNEVRQSTLFYFYPQCKNYVSEIITLILSAVILMYKVIEIDKG